MRVIALLGAMVLLLAAPPALAQDDQAALIERAAQELGGNDVYVHPDARAEVSSAQEQDIESAIADADAGTVY
ncbi:MAG: hypothetical protein M3454_08930, partial [Actinomycetota bacterium]|nr:hypothetical protein [Actinomycetota bacterium]